MVNLSGISFDHRMTEDTGASVVDVIRAWLVSREVFDFAALWSEIDALDATVPLDTQFDLFLDCRRMVERGALWVLRHRRPPFGLSETVAHLKPGISELAVSLGAKLRGRMADVVMSEEASRLAAGVPESLAERAAAWPVLHTAFDIVDLAESTGRRVGELSAVQWELFDALDLMWLWEGIGSLPRSDRWQTQARSALRDDLLSTLAELTAACVRSGGSVDEWMSINARPVSRVGAMLTEIRRAESYDLTTLSVALRQLRNLALTSRSTSAASVYQSVWARRQRRAIGAHCVLGHEDAGSVDGVVGSVGCSMSPRYRFAPSPTGIFHIGGARTALYNWALAKQQGGTFVLRIEDTDEVRNHPEWTQGIIDGLAWIGISADDPTFEGPYFQSSYAAAHVAAAERLYRAGPRLLLRPDARADRGAGQGAAASPATTATRATAGSAPGPAGCCASGCPTAETVIDDVIRGAVTFENEHIEDFVLLRGNGSPMFLLANVVDDIEMGITHVVRGEEHLSNTPKQQLLWSALGRAPPVWAHVPILVNEARKKLSKRRDKVALESYRDDGYLADGDGQLPDDARLGATVRRAGRRPGSESEIVPWSVIEESFHLEDVTHSPAFFDLKKLAAFNGEYIRMLTTDEFVAACEPFLPAEYDREIFAAMAPHVQTRVVTLAEAAPMVDFLMRPDPVIDHDSWTKAMHQPWSRAVLVETAGGLCPGLVGCRLAEGRARAGRHVARRQARQGPGAGACRGHRSQRRPSAVRVAGGARPRRDDPAARRRRRPACWRAVTSARRRCDRPAVARVAAEPSRATTRRWRRSGRSRRARSPASTTSSTSRGGQPVGRRSPPAAVEDRPPLDCSPSSSSSPATTRVSLVQVYATGRSDQVEQLAGRRHRRARRRPVRRAPVAAARRPSRPRRRRCTRGVAPLIVVTGGKQPDDRFTEAESSAQYLVDRGVPAERDRDGEQPGARRTSRWRAPPTCSSSAASTVCVVVTDPYHALRVPPDRPGRRADGVRVADADLRRPRRQLGAPPPRRSRRRRPRPDHRLRPPVTPASAATDGCLTGPLRPLRHPSVVAGGKLVGRSDGEWCNWQHSRFWFCN